jgi:hypothetical protein
MLATVGMERKMLKAEQRIHHPYRVPAQFAEKDVLKW